MFCVPLRAQNIILTECVNRTTTLFQCNETTGPYHYFRLYVDLFLYGHYHDDPNDNGIRIGGFELFGALFDRKETTNILKCFVSTYIT